MHYDGGRPSKKLSPDEVLAIILDICRVRKVGEYATFCCVLTAYAESDFDTDARSKNPTSSGFYSEGVFQQTLPWWKNNHYSVQESCNAFLDAFEPFSESPVIDCWTVQRWSEEPTFTTSVETQNYIRRLPVIQEMIRTGHVPRI